eukprot:1325059-Lingulodinium_polyedra.AAC.1
MLAGLLNNKMSNTQGSDEHWARGLPLCSMSGQAESQELDDRTHDDCALAQSHRQRHRAPR